jgi:peptide deformylase
MAIREIIKIGNPLLREKAKRVRQFNGALKTLVDDMVETLHAAPGVGLAANQIGVLQRVVVVELPKDEDDRQSGKLYTVVNPEIIKASSELEECEEACLSVPGYVGDVSRAVWVTVKGQDTKGKDVRVKAYDYLARVFQHEIDHLDGILYIDQVDDPAKVRKIPPEVKEEELEPATA